MKKLLALILMLILALSVASCDLINPPDEPDEPEEHVCEFELVKTTATCTADGEATYKCSCGKTDKRPDAAKGHVMIDNGGSAPTCTSKGTKNSVCDVCGYFSYEMTDALGHIYHEPDEPSRFAYCEREGCLFSEPAFPTTGEHSDKLMFTFSEEEKNILANKHQEMLDILEGADKYDPTLHAYAESGALYDEYMAAEEIYNDYTDLIYEAMDQRAIASVLYYCHFGSPDSAEYEKIFNDMSEYYSSLVSTYYSLSQPWYDSKFREFFFYGATEEEINAFLFDSNAYANPEYTALHDRNTEIELIFDGISDPLTSPFVPELYAEVVANNNRIAEILGYDNYLEYAYENVYDRDYTYQDVAAFTEYVKDHMAAIYTRVYTNYIALLNMGANYTQNEIFDYYSIVRDSVFELKQSNELFNNYIDDMNMGFTSNPDKQISFSDGFNSLVTGGNMFRGGYEAAYVTYLHGAELPIVFFGEGLDNTMTVAHEFGHYMNELYNKSEYNQSYDLLETHSQGNEVLFMYYLEGKISNTGYMLAEHYAMYSMLSAVISALRVDCFEQAIYLNEYDGTYADQIMADGKITSDEYDLLYESIGLDFGIDDEGSHDYWRYGMTISSPCYYVSYSISAINALQLYGLAHRESFDAAKESYLKLFTYTDVDPDMDTEEILLYAGLTSYNDIQTYLDIEEFFNTMFFTSN